MSAIGRNRMAISCVFVFLATAFSLSAATAQEKDRKPVSSADSATVVLPGYEDIGRRVSEFAERELKDKGIPALSIAIIDGDKVVFARGFGAASADGKVPATADSIYRVGSVSKLFTDICVMRLVAEGKLDLD